MPFISIVMCQIYWLYNSGGQIGCLEAQDKQTVSGLQFLFVVAWRLSGPLMITSVFHNALCDYESHPYATRFILCAAYSQERKHCVALN